MQTFSNAVGYSGKPIHVLVGIDPTESSRGIKLVDHKEPIVLVGIPEKRIVDAMNTPDRQGHGAGRDAARRRPPQVDIVSGATVTVLVMGDSVVRSAVRLIRSGRLGGPAEPAARPPPRVAKRSISARARSATGKRLLGDGSVRRLSLTVGEVNEAFDKAGNRRLPATRRPASPADTFIDLYVAPVSACRPSGAACSATRATSG